MDDFRKTGFSKDGKHSNPQIYLGLLVGLNGYAIGYDIYEGNIFEGNTLIPFKHLSDRINFARIKNNTENHSKTIGKATRTVTNCQPIFLGVPMRKTGKMVEFDK